MSRLERYLEEREEQFSRGERELQGEELTPGLKRIIGVYESWLQESNTNHQSYSLICEQILGVYYTSKDVREFSVCLKAYEEHRIFSSSGLFLSALVNCGQDNEYVILTEHLETEIDFLGYSNTKDITIIGDAGNNLGTGMVRESLTIKGHAGENTGSCMLGGTLSVEGSIESISPWCSGGMIWEAGKLIKAPSWRMSIYNLTGGRL